MVVDCRSRESSRAVSATRPLLALTIVLAVAAAAAFAVAAVNLVEEFADAEVLFLAAGGPRPPPLWPKAGSMRSRGDCARFARSRTSATRPRQVERRPRGRGRFLPQGARPHARPRAGPPPHISWASRSGRSPRRRRTVVERQAERACRAHRGRRVGQERLERRLMAWAADLDRGQRVLETKLTELGNSQRELSPRTRRGSRRPSTSTPRSDELERRSRSFARIFSAAPASPRGGPRRHRAERGGAQARPARGQRAGCAPASVLCESRWSARRSRRGPADSRRR